MFFFTAVALVAFVAAANAGTVNLTAQVVAAYDNATNFNPVTPIPDISTNVGVSRLYEVSLRANITGLGAGERNFALTTFDISFNGLANELGYTSSDETIDINPSPVNQQGPIFGINQQTAPTAGAPAGSVGALASLNAGLPSNSPIFAATNVGDNPEVGQVFVTWDGVTPASLVLSNIVVGFMDTAGTFLPTETLSGNVTLSFGSTVQEEGILTVTPSSILFNDFPLNNLTGPTTLVDAIKVENTGNAALTLTGASLAGGATSDFAVEAVAPGTILAPGASLLLDATYLGVPLAELLPGTVLTDTLTISSSVGNATVGLSINVPEPSTVALASLTLVGLVGLARRRK